jgi:hypothetical protein
MTAHVWISACRADSTLIKMVTADIVENDFETAVKASRMQKAGDVVPVHMLPKVIWVDKRKGRINSFPAFFNGNGYWIVSRKAADIISMFDLGDGGLYPVQIFQSDRTTPVEGEFLCLNVGAQKTAFLPEQSPRAFKRPELEEWSLPSAPKDDVFHVSAAALRGSEVWWDPRVRSGFFLSEALGAALKKAGMAKAFRLYRCSVVEG